MKNKKIFVISGMSGAGKTQVLKIFEDLGFYCVDNIPFILFEDFISYAKSEKNINNFALGLDIRSRENLKDTVEKIKKFKKQLKIKVIFLNAENKCLIQRYSETKHKHPLGDQISAALTKERELLLPIKEIADKEIDTSTATLGVLKEKISNLLEIKRSQDMQITISSFGFKYGAPSEADIIMDVRFLKNPYYIKKFRDKNGLDDSVRDYVLKAKDAKEFLKMFLNMIKKLIPLYIKEGKSYLTIAIGCTGGRHRSVAIAKYITEHLKKLNFDASEFHRDLKK